MWTDERMMEDDAIGWIHQHMDRQEDGSCGWTGDGLTKEESLLSFLSSWWRTDLPEKPTVGTGNYLKHTTIIGEDHSGKRRLPTDIS